MNGAIARFWTLSGWRQAPGRDGSIPTFGRHQLVADYVEVLDRTLDPIGDHHRPPLAPDLFVIDRLVELLVARDRQVVHQHVDDESPPRHTARTHTDTRPHPAHECLPVALLVADGGFALSSVSQKEALELRSLRPLPPPPSDAPGAMGRVVAQSIIAFSAPAAALGALGAMGAILRALSGRADIFKCGLPPLLLWRVISIPKGPQCRGELFIRRLSTCSLTDDLFQPVVEIARRTFPRLALLLLHERPDSINVLFAEPCTPVITSTEKGPVGAERRRAAAAQQRVTHLGEQCASTSMMRASALYRTNAH